MDENFRIERIKHIEDKFDDAQLNPREEISIQNIRCITHTPLLIGCVQFGGLNSTHVPVMNQELAIRQHNFHAHEADHHG